PRYHQSDALQLVVRALHISLFFFTAPAPSQIYPLSLHDALPISGEPRERQVVGEHQQHVGIGARERLRLLGRFARGAVQADEHRDRKSTRLNSSHVSISYAVFCLKKKKYKVNIRHEGTHLLLTSR